MDLNLTPELAELTIFTANVATAIRMNTAYNGDPRQMPHSAEDSMWFSYCLHNLDSLGKAILQGNRERIVETCEVLISNYNWYLSVEPGKAGIINGVNCNPSASFERHKKLISLEQGKNILCKIVIKTRV